MDGTFSEVVAVSPKEAKRKANNYLSLNVATGIYADDPTLVCGNEAYWKLGLSLRLPDLETTEIPGAVEINAVTGEVNPIPPNQLKKLLDIVDDIAKRLTLETAPTR